MKVSLAAHEYKQYWELIKRQWTSGVFACDLLGSATDTPSFITGTKKSSLALGRASTCCCLLLDNITLFCHFVSFSLCNPHFCEVWVFFSLFHCSFHFFSAGVSPPPSCIAGCAGTAVWAAATEIQCVSKSLSKEMDASLRLLLHSRITEWNRYNASGVSIPLGPSPASRAFCVHLRASARRKVHRTPF